MGLLQVWGGVLCGNVKIKKISIYRINMCSWLGHICMRRCIDWWAERIRRWLWQSIRFSCSWISIHWFEFSFFRASLQWPVGNYKEGRTRQGDDSQGDSWCSWDFRQDNWGETCFSCLVFIKLKEDHTAMFHSCPISDSESLFRILAQRLRCLFSVDIFIEDSQPVGVRIH